MEATKNVLKAFNCVCELNRGYVVEALSTTDFTLTSTTINPSLIRNVITSSGDYMRPTLPLP